MSKSRYTAEFKKQVIEEYNSGIGGYKQLAKKHSMSPKTVKIWVVNSNKTAKEVVETNTVEEKMKSFMYLYPEEFEKLKNGENISRHLSMTPFWINKILNWAIKAKENNSNEVILRLIRSKETLSAKIIEIKTTIKDDLKEFVIIFKLFNDK